jgi:hypothetical protein
MFPAKAQRRQVRGEEFDHKERIKRKEIFYVNFAVNNSSRRLGAALYELSVLAG